MKRVRRKIAKPSGAILVDSMLLLLFVVGSVDRRLIRSHKRLKAYKVEDYDHLVALLGTYSKIVTTPNILTEVSNLAPYLALASAEVKSQMLQFVAALTVTLEERYLPSRKVAELEEFRYLGLTDSGHLLVEGTTVLTADLHLYRALLLRGITAINFNQQRGKSWI